jgi:thiol:disulfide interchange protein DsbC
VWIAAGRRGPGAGSGDPQDPAERFPNFPKIDEVSKTPIPASTRCASAPNIFYSDEQGDHIIQGAMIDTKTRTNLTDARIDKLTASTSSLPLKDAVVIKQGTGARKLAVFVDPNCGYCKKFERDLQR